ncbi:multi-sensor hybrid histidine kinase [Arcticibacter svalbardensis MN12-7]|uniref:Sensory/regulatory protein RpfC n=1 Tax=Arcticibacter svalbardensis MN12-7 TaxID=1150600 RepID=R9GPG2_9SPHI|nr:response regulator [Arcticibacter svalbardensis]EOR93712.1 multi-sensor hybrid histidine kinase [Arcticibacter svalbardensis MN12-7]
MKKHPVPYNEQERLNALQNYEILDSLSEEEFDRVTELASIICDVPVSLISLIDKHRQWFKSKVGLNITETPRDLAFCQYAIMDVGIFEIEDATKDQRFMENELVTGFPNIRFYAGQPLIDPNGYALGTLCVIDHEPKKLSDTQKRALQLLAQNVITLIVERRQKIELKNFQKLFHLSNDLICIASVDGFFKKVNPAFEKVMGWNANLLMNTSIFDLIHTDDIENTKHEIERLIQGHDTINFIHRLKTKENCYKTLQWAISPEPLTGNLFAIARDITLERSKELALIQSEKKANAFFDNSQGFMCTHDLKGNFLSVNSAGASILGYTQEEILKSGLFDIIPVTRHAFLQNYLAEIEQEGSSKGQMVTQHKDKSFRIWMYNNILEKNLNGESYVIGNAVDITERHYLEEDLRHTKDMLEQTNKVARVGGWEMNVQSQKISWTSVTREIHGADPGFEPDLTSGISFYKEGKSRDDITKAVNEAITEGKSWDLELQIITVQGKEIWVRALGDAEIENGTCKRIYGTFQDINLSKLIELDLMNEKARLSAFVQHAPAAVAMLDNKMCYIAVSNRWLEDANAVGQNIIGTSHYDLALGMTDERRERHKRVLNGAIEKKEEDTISLVGVAENQYITWEMRPWYQYNGQIGGMMIFTQNITSIIRQREELKVAKLLAEQASVAKSEFLANMSHEIRTPLNGVIGFTDLVLKTNLNETQQQYLSIVNQSANALLSIINDILDFSKIEAGKLELDIEKCDLYEMSCQATDIISYQVQKKGLEMLLNISPDLPRFIYADTMRLKQILINLLGNASKFTDKGEIELKIETLIAQANQTMIRFEVRDTGIGIKPEKQSKIFEAFSQEDGSTTKKYGGTGLGLTISNKLLGLMNSRLQIKSSPGKGSIFYFDVSFKSEQGDAINWENIDQIKQVLVVDDNDNNRLIISQMLLLKNIRTTEARNGFEALQLLSKGGKYDVILMDYHMPFMDGLETIKKIHDSFHTSPTEQSIILLHSSSDDGKIIKACEGLQVSHRLVKPVKMQDIYNALSRLHKKEIKITPVKDQLAEISEHYFNVLIAEDNMVNMLLTRTIIHKFAPNAIITEANNGIEALNIFRRNTPDLILMDVQMPEMNGYEATKAIRLIENGIHTPIVALTAGNVKGEKEKCLAAGMDDFVVKPIVEEMLIAVFNKWLKNTHQIGNKPKLEEDIDEALHFNINKLISYVGDDESILKEVLSLVKEELIVSIQVMEKCIHAKDLKGINEAGHKLYGTAVSSGLNALSKIANEFEHLDTFSLPDLQILVTKAQDEIKIVLKLVNKFYHNK